MVATAVLAVLAVGGYATSAHTLGHSLGTLTSHSATPPAATSTGVGDQPTALPGVPAPATASAVAAPSAATPASTTHAPLASNTKTAPESAPAVIAPLAPLAHRLTPDLLVRADHPLAVPALAAVRALVPGGGSTVVRAGTVVIGKSKVYALGVDPGQFREFTPAGTAEATAVWQAVANGEAVITHATAARLHLPLGGTILIGPGAGGPGVPLRLGALATTTVPGSDVIVNLATAAKLGLGPQTGVVLAGNQADPATLAKRSRTVLGNAPRIDLLAQPAGNPVAFLTGSVAARAFGAFSYRYFSDGTIEPALDWVLGNIRTESVPILGRVTCHKLMFPQLRGALSQVVAEGLANTIKPGQYGGCYVPRFIESNPDRSVSLHTWGIAIDLNVPGNERGTVGEMNRRVVAIFKSWGFRWGGDWSYTDPMHFELGALLKNG